MKLLCRLLGHRPVTSQPFDAFMPAFTLADSGVDVTVHKLTVATCERCGEKLS